jgi:CheY-like chemotaxis protein
MPQKVKKPSVFLCDDDADIVEVTRYILEQRYDVHVFMNADKILESALTISPDVILLDLRMPGESGDSVARSLKMHPGTKNIPVILFSASNDLEKIASATEVDAWLAKPYDIDRLLDLIETFIPVSS